MSQLIIGSMERFFKKIKIVGSCWEWQTGKDKDGYGKFWINGKTVIAHRFSYEYLKGKIPEGLQIDHLCRNRSCVNPDHLEAVTSKENCYRGVGLCAQNAKKTHCPQGHEYTKENTYYHKINKNCRRCITCNRIQRVQYYHNKKLEVTIP